MSGGVTADKAAARKAAAERRAEAHAAEAGRRRRSASAALAAHLAGTEGRIISAYLPIRTEADPLPAMAALAGANRLCVPVVEGKGLPLSFREWRPGCHLVDGPFGVKVPEGGAVLVPDVLVVPMLAFDAGLYRLGYGGGFYDRTLAALRASGGCRAVGFAFAAQEVAGVPRDATDEPLDEIVTERGVRLRR